MNGITINCVLMKNVQNLFSLLPLGSKLNCNGCRFEAKFMQVMLKSYKPTSHMV